MLDKNFFDQIQKILSRLTAVVILLDDKGQPILPDSSADPLPIPSGLELGRPQVIDNRTWLPVAVAPIAYIVVYGIEAASVDCAQLANALLQSLVTTSPVMDRNDACRRVLREEINSPELEAVANEHNIPMDLERCVMLFHVTQTTRESAYEMLNELIPASAEDMLVEMDRHTLVLLKSMDQVESIDELMQLAEAVEQTLVSETANQVSISIGEPKPTFATVGESYREARRAMEVGRVFRPDAHVFLYRRLVMERFLTEIPKEMGARYHHIMFNRKTARLFNDEMLHTIEMFFAKDLNLSDTARQLYIHRNTLVYRLDKVQRQTGLDLRKFEDAITFKLLLLLGKCGNDKPSQIH